MIYTNGFKINAAGGECFITLVQNRPEGETKISSEVDTVVMTEQCARQLCAALTRVYAKIDEDRAKQSHPELMGKPVQVS